MLIKKIQKFLRFPEFRLDDYKGRDSSIWDWFATILVLHVPFGGFYWTYISWELGSWIMFWCVCLMPISIPVGSYMLYFGVPNWVLTLFG